MSSRPYMQFYPADYLLNTKHLSTVEHGAYLLLIMHYWGTRGIPNDDVRLARIVGLSVDDWLTIRSTVVEFFDEVDGEWRHGRIDADMAELDESQERRSIAGQKAGLASAKARKVNRSSTIGSTNVQRFSTIPSSSSLSSLPTSDVSSSVSEGKKELVERGPRPFDRFWELYPNKVGKRDAEKMFDRVMKTGRVDFETLMAGLLRYASKTDDRPWCNPATWLNQDRWTDQPAEVQNGKSVLAAADRIIEQFGGAEAARAYVPGSSGPKPLSMDFGVGPSGVRCLPKG